MKEKEQMNKHRKLIATGDGSHTLYNEALDEHYHSVHGAINESMHVFITHGLHYASKEKGSLNILEVGLGTGLNALLTYFEAEEKGLKISYDAIEAYPLNEEEAGVLNYPSRLVKWPAAPSVLLRLHALPWEEKQALGKHFFFRKMLVKTQDFRSHEKYDLIYFDAFGPRVQPELWEQEVMDKMFTLLKKGGALVTYCAKGEVKRRMKSAGFEVISLPGPPGKREMTRAISR